MKIYCIGIITCWAASYDYTVADNVTQQYSGQQLRQTESNYQKHRPDCPRKLKPNEDKGLSAKLGSITGIQTNLDLSELGKIPHLGTGCSNRCNDRLLPLRPSIPFLQKFLPRLNICSDIDVDVCTCFDEKSNSSSSSSSSNSSSCDKHKNSNNGHWAPWNCGDGCNKKHHQKESGDDSNGYLNENRKGLEGMSLDAQAMNIFNGPVAIDNVNEENGFGNNALFKIIEEKAVEGGNDGTVQTNKLLRPRDNVCLYGFYYPCTNKSTYNGKAASAQDCLKLCENSVCGPVWSSYGGMTGPWARRCECYPTKPTSNPIFNIENGSATGFGTANNYAIVDDKLAFHTAIASSSLGCSIICVGISNLYNGGNGVYSYLGNASLCSRTNRKCPNCYCYWDVPKCGRTVNNCATMGPFIPCELVYSVPPCKDSD